jgi:hypothetical protein
MSKKDNPGKKFLSNFLNKPYGSKSFLGINLPEFGFSEKFDTNVPQPAPTTTPTDPNKTQLGDPFNRQQYNRDFRNMLLTDTALRDFEMRREKQRNLDMFRQTMPLVDIAAETAAQRRLMEDRSSPTKISQQILRARTGEATLMDAVARQGNTAVNIATAGLSPRGRAGGR